MYLKAISLPTYVYNLLSKEASGWNRSLLHLTAGVVGEGLFSSVKEEKKNNRAISKPFSLFIIFLIHYWPTFCVLN